MDDTKKMLRTIINGQSAMKSELLAKVDGVDRKVGGLSSRIDGLETKMDDGFKKLTRRVDMIGLQVAKLEDDTPTREEHDELEKKVEKLEQKVAVI
jgi:ubiquinone biosynthesis protein UbiJ